jgi:hypothetical protein
MKNAPFEVSFDIPWTIKDEFNRVYELESGELKLPFKYPLIIEIKVEKKKTTEESTFSSMSSMKNYLKIVKKTLNCPN